MLKVTISRTGICTIIGKARANGKLSLTEVRKLREEMHKFLRNKSWHSDDDYYPIAHPMLGAYTAFNTCDKWNEATEYGRRRRATLAHLNNYLEELRS